MNLLPIILLGGLGYLFFHSSKDLINKISYKFKDAKIDKQNTSFSTVSANLILGVQNDSVSAVNLDRIYLLYYIKGNLVGRTDVSQLINIKKLGETKISIPISLSTSILLQALGISLTDLIVDKINPSLTIQGKLFFKGIAIPVDEKIDFKIA